MLIDKPNPIGIDKLISSLQKKIYPLIAAKWQGVFNMYPRIYRNQDDKNDYVAEFFDGKDYREVYFDDTVAGLSFVGLSGESTLADDGIENTNIHIVFFVDLIKIKGASSQRLDEEARLDVQGILDTIGRNQGFVLRKVGSGIDYCLKEYPGSRQSEGLKFRDQHPLHCFRFDLAVWYSPTLINCS
ncbi:MAG: hypothetical protein Q8941_20520 [Bacteroidota bacterium]|nr:hypothetical protein [Bacteroidota bacterium]